MDAVAKTERQIEVVNQFIDIYKTQDFNAALEFANNALKEFPNDGTLLVYKISCLHTLNRLDEAEEFRNYVEHEIVKDQFSQQEKIYFIEFEAELELTKTFTEFSSWNEKYQCSFPASYQEYLAGKKHLDNSMELHVGSSRFEERHAQYAEILKYAKQKVFIGSNAVWKTVLVISFVLGAVLFFDSHRSVPRFSDPRLGLPRSIIHLIICALIYRFGMYGPRYRLARQQAVTNAVNGSMLNTFLNTKNSRWKTTYANGRTEFSSGSEQLNVGITFLAIKFGFLMFQITAAPLFVAINWLKNFREIK